MEKWILWKDQDYLSTKYYLDFIYVEEELNIVLSDSQHMEKKIRIVFPGVLCAYRKTSFKNRAYILSHQHPKEFYENWTFFKIIDSSYIKWMEEESNSISNAHNLQHFCLITKNYILDVLHVDGPKIEFI